MKFVYTISFDEVRFEKTGELFPEHIANDDWIVYHGTSSVCENEIERAGFLPNTHSVTKEEVQAVVSIYEKMNWCGVHMGGYAVLKPFSLEHDFVDPRGKPVYFAESSYGASLYAMRDFSGGECARALRYTLADLKKYIELSSVRDEHHRQLHREYTHLKYNNELYREAVAPVDLQWLKHEMNALETLLPRCHEPYHNHTHGVVYAVKFSKEDSGKLLEYGRSMGIKSFTPVSPEHIVAKVKVPADFQRSSYFQDNKRLDVLINKRGLYAMF